MIATATRARKPFLDVAHVGATAHVNAIGAITPERRELTAALVATCGPVVADSPAAARRLTSELRGVAEVHALADVLADPALALRADGPTLFNAMGIGLADIALGGAVLARAVAAGAGRPLPRPRRAAPRRRSCARPQSLLTRPTRGDPIPSVTLSSFQPHESALDRLAPMPSALAA